MSAAEAAAAALVPAATVPMPFERLPAREGLPTAAAPELAAVEDTADCPGSQASPEESQEAAVEAAAETATSSPMRTVRTDK